MAPGASVASASNTNDDSYGVASGTSLSCPHVAGTVALLLAADGTHTPETIRQALTTSVDTATLQDDTSNLNCGAGKKFPNFILNDVEYFPMKYDTSSIYFRCTIHLIRTESYT